LHGPIPHGSSLIHAAPYVGPDSEQSKQINVTGTGNLIAAARSAGAKRIIYVSTTAVYGMGPHRNLRVEDAPIRPTSIRSQHRREAEKLQPGTVLRPHLVYGAGDAWVIPALLTVPRIVGGLLDGGTTTTSVISVTTLAELLARLLAMTATAIAGRAFHAVHPTPVTIRNLVTLAAGALDEDVPLSPAPLATAQPKLTAAGFSEHQVDMASNDRWYTPDLWNIARLPDSPPFTLAEPDINWYRALMRRRRMSSEA
jgi:nucleoside-diphosphate-sugar epimerase